MDQPNQYDVSAFRPGAAPVLDLAAAGITPRPNQQPQWHLLTPALVRLLQQHFSVATRIEDPNLVDYVWTDTESSPIVISSLANWKPDSTNARPALLVDRLEQSRDMSKRAIGDRYQGVRPGHHSFMMQGAHVVHVLGGRDGEADSLAREVWRDIARFAPILGPKLCLLRLLPMQIGKRVQLDEHKQTYTVPVPIQYGYFEAYRLFPTDEAAVTAIVTTLTTPHIP